MQARTLTFFALILLLLNGCSGYRLGSMLPSNIQSVYVRIAKNSTPEPDLETEVTQAVLAQLQVDGSLKVVGEAEADSLLTIDIREFLLEPLRYDGDNRVRPNEYRMVLRASVELIRASDATPLVRSAGAEGKATFELSGDLTNSKRNALPAASEDLARSIVAAVTEAWPDAR
jgi:hypothetical protein